MAAPATNKRYYRFYHFSEAKGYIACDAYFSDWKDILGTGTFFEFGEIQLLLFPNRTTKRIFDLDEGKMLFLRHGKGKTQIFIYRIPNRDIACLNKDKEMSAELSEIEERLAELAPELYKRKIELEEMIRKNRNILSGLRLNDDTRIGKRKKKSS